MANIQCIIFDLDDTLVESEPIWAEAYSKLYKILGQEFYRKDLLKYLGMTILDVSRDAHSLFGVTQYTIEECATMLRKFLLQGYDGNIKLMPGVSEFLQKINGRYKLSIASGSPREAIQKTIKAKGWGKIFTHYVSSEEVEHGKPEPDVFLETARRLGCKPKHSLVIEDGVKGVIAAKKAGMLAFYVKNPPDPEAISRADRYFLSMKDIQPYDLEKFENDSI
ncbi:MAG: HAD family phosphatase [Candidatus Atribacteria bacterium]|nr:HAD family phosphatase [Candidatus Atribacteria bacterium]